MGQGGLGGATAVPCAPPQLGGAPAAPASAPAVPVNGQVPAQQTGAGMTDYSQQWIEYYRSQGMHAEADKIEQQLKAAKVSNGVYI